MDLYEGLLNFEDSGTKVYIPQETYSIDLSLTENPLGFSEEVARVIEEEKENISHYPDPYHRELRSFLSEQHNIPQDKFIFGTGADGLIENIVRVLVNPGDKVVMPELTFLNVAFATTIAQGNPIYSPMKGDFHVDFVGLEEKIDQNTKLVFICNPNNPTGLTEPKTKILALIESTQATVVVDEANIEFGGESVIQHVNEYNNLLVLRTFSKGYGLAGMRIGYCVGNEDLMYYIWRLRPPFTNTHLAQKAALAALKDKEHLQKSRAYVATERKYLTQELETRDFDVVASQANCFLTKVTPKFAGSTEFNNQLHEHDATVVDGRHFHGLGKEYVRIAPRLRTTNKAFLAVVDKLLE